MDNFLEVIYASQISNSKKGDRYDDFFKPFFGRMKELMSERLYDEMEEIFIACVSQNNSYYAVEGMKLAIGIMDGTYVPET